MSLFSVLQVYIWPYIFLWPFSIYKPEKNKNCQENILTYFFFGFLKYLFWCLYVSAYDRDIFCLSHRTLLICVPIFRKFNSDLFWLLLHFWDFKIGRDTHEMNKVMFCCLLSNHILPFIRSRYYVIITNKYT